MNLQKCFLDLAQLEENGAELYRKLAEECNEKLKPVVILFSQEEEKHKKVMLELSGDEELKEKQVDENIEKFFQKQFDYSNNKILNLTSEKEFFRFALQLEKDSIEIYTKMLIIFEKDSYGYKNFENLIKEERKHMLYILNKLYELK